MRRLALIPARGGSKRLPRKNILDFNGMPIIAWTIAAALESGMFDRVVVSTEDAEIAGIAKHHGADVVARPEGLATDTATVVDVCLDVLKNEKAAGRDYDVLCCLYATAPLRGAGDIKALLNMIKPGESDFGLCVTHYDLPPQQALRLTGKNKAEVMWPDLNEVRTADLGELVVDNGSTYAVSVPAFLKHKTFYGPGLCVHVMPRERSQDIDTHTDLDLARYFANKEGGRK